MDKSLKEEITVKHLLKMNVKRRENGKYAPNMLLTATRKDAIVHDWLKNYPPTTQAKYSSDFNVFLVRGQKTPKDVLELDIKELKLLVKQVAGNLIAENKYGSAQNIVNALVSFTIHYKEQYGTQLEFSYSEKIRSTQTKTEYTPKPYQIYAIANAGQAVSRPNNPKNKALIKTAWTTSIRENGIADLRCGAVMGYTESDCPIPIHVGNERQQIGVDDFYCRDDKIAGYGIRHFYTFIAKEAFIDIEDWLRWRKSKMGTFDKKDYLFTNIKTGPDMGNKMHTTSIWWMYKNAVGVSGTGIDATTTTFHMLRNAFKSVCINADVDDEIRQAMMGHSGVRSEGNYFDYNDKEMARKQYMKADWSMTGTTRVDRIEQENAELQAKLRRMESDVQTIKDRDGRQSGKDINERLAYLEGLFYGKTGMARRKRNISGSIGTNS